MWYHSSAGNVDIDTIDTIIRMHTVITRVLLPLTIAAIT